MRETYPWKRFWVPRDGLVHLDSYGYMIDPEGPAQYMNPDVLPFAKIERSPCLALLGEPGMGKTYALQELGRQAREQGDVFVLSLDLRSYSDQGLLYDALFESPGFLSWVNSTGRLELILDSLDECMVHVRTVSAMLVDELKKYPRSRMRLRIACRTAEWPRLLEEELPGLWGEENFGVFELTPLRRDDVRIAAESHGFSADDFLRGVENKDVGPFAATPFTLEMLLRLFEEHAELPGDQSELYARGCLERCRDPSLSRTAAGASGQLTPKERLAIAVRIAALTVFGKRAAIYIDPAEDGANEQDLRIAEISGEDEPYEGGTVPVSSTNVREVMTHTQLFSGRGPSRLGWAHWTYAEYLAAAYLTKHDLRQAQICDLLLHPGAEERKRVVPQLAETAAWLAGMQGWFLDIIAEEDPQVLLRSAVVRASDAQKEHLTAVLLRLTENGQLSDAEVELRRRYDVLGHPGIAGQLRPIITDKSKDTMLRRVAIDIAERNSVIELMPELLGVALESSDVPHIRAQAAHAVAEIGTDEDKAQLIPLLDCPAEQDPDDDLRGNALKALWPGSLSAREVFEVVRLPNNSEYIGMYAAFLGYELAKGLSSSDLPVALSWVNNQPPDHELPFPFGRLLSKILRRAWEHLDRAEVLTSLAETTIIRLRRHDTILGAEDPKESVQLVKQDAEKRKKLVAAILHEPGTSSEDAPLLAWSDLPLVLPGDFAWLLEKSNTAFQDSSEKWGRLGLAVFDCRNRTHVALVLDTAGDNLGVRRTFADWLEPVRLDCPEAAERRRQYDRHQEIQRRREKEPPGLPRPFREILLERLEKFEGGAIDAWWRLNVDMTVDPVRGVCQLHKELQPDLRALPGWEAMDAGMRERTVDAAAEYLEVGEPDTDQWLGTNTVHRPAFAGYRAARLLLAERSDRLDEVSQEAWAKWAPIIVAFPEPIGIGEAEPMEALVQTAYANAPDQTIEALLALIDKENAESRPLHILRKFERCWDVRLRDVLLEKTESDGSLRPTSVGNILDHTLQHDGSKVVEYALSLISSGTDSARAIELAREAAAALLKHCPREGWPGIWNRMSGDPQWGKDLFKYFAYHHDRVHNAELGNRLPPDKVAQLYLWLYRHFPPADDPKHDGVHGVGDREAVAMYRDTLVARLRERGAVVAIRQIRDELPDVKWLTYTEIAAEKNRLWGSWEGVNPSALRKMVKDTDSRLVQSGGQLLQVLTESMERLEAELQGAPPAVQDLWNTRGAVNPKDEKDLSDYIARYLRRDLTGRGIVANREVRIRPSEETDIKVDALHEGSAAAGASVVSVIVEVKGCWHSDLKTAMQTQLRDRYMADNECRHGLYVVGWFLSEQWDTGDYRKARTPGWSLREAREFFRSQAEEVSEPMAQVRAFVLNACYR